MTQVTRTVTCRDQAAPDPAAPPGFPFPSAEGSEAVSSSEGPQPWGHTPGWQAQQLWPMHALCRASWLSSPLIPHSARLNEAPLGCPGPHRPLLPHPRPAPQLHRVLPLPNKGTQASQISPQTGAFLKSENETVLPLDQS